MTTENRNEILLCEKSPSNAVYDKNSEKVKWKYIKYQIFLCNISGLFTINNGIAMAFSNLLLHEVDAETSSWFASLVCISSTVGALVSGPMMDKMGRRSANVFIGLPCTAAWFITSISTKDDLLLLYTSRLLAGFASGLTAVNSVYISEIAHKNYRPMLLSWLAIQASAGILLTTILNLIFTWRQAAVCFTILFTVVTVLIAVLTPETPVWLATFRSDMDGAKKSLKMLYSSVQIYDKEWKSLKQTAHITSNDQFAKRKINYNFSSPSAYRPLCILAVLFLLQSLSGIYPSLFYAIDIFAAFSPLIGRILQNEVFVIFGVIRLTATIACCLLSVKVGRRPIMLFSSIGMLISCAILTACTFDLSTSNTNLVDEHLNDLSAASVKEWIAMGTFFVLVFTSNIGIMCIPWMLVVELLPTEIKGVGGTIILTYANLLIFGTTKIFPFILHTVHIAHLFAFFAVVSVGLIIVILFYIPETLRKTFDEINAFFLNL